MMDLAWPWCAALLPLPLLARALLPPAPSLAGAVRVPFYARLAGETGPPRVRPGHLLLAMAGWLALVAAAVRPQWVDEPIALPATGRNLLLAVDISGSMETADLFLAGQPATRLAVVKRVLGEFLERRAGDRVGLILFGRRAYLQTPLTFDRQTAAQMLDEAVIGLAGKETAIGDAIGLAVKRLREQDPEQRVLILLTDGANTAGAVDPLKAAQLAAAESVRIYTIGVGADEMMVRSLFGSRRVNPSADLDEQALTTIAAETGGRYFRARDTGELVEIYAELDELEPVESDEDLVRPRRELFQWPLGLAMGSGLLLLVLRAGGSALREGG